MLRCTKKEETGMATKNTTKTNNTKTGTKKPGYIKQPKNQDNRYRWESGAGVCAVSDIKPIKRGQ